MSNVTQKPGITGRFNLELFVFVMTIGEIQFLLSDKATNVPVQGLMICSTIDMLRVTIILLITAYFIREIWNRMIVTILALRTVTFQESMTLVLALCLLNAS